MSVKFVAPTLVHNVISIQSIDPDMKRLIEQFDGELKKQLDDTKKFDDVGASFYIDDMD